MLLIEASCGSATLRPTDGGTTGGKSGTGGGGAGSGGTGGATGAGGAAGAKGTAGTTGGAGGAAGAAGHEGGGVDAGRDMGPVKQPNGHACSAGTDCSSGFCAQNVCCGSACTDTCYACTNMLTGSSPDGTCAVVSSGLSDPAGGCAAGTATSCGNTGHCDGKGACEKLGGTTTCKAAACGSSGFTSASTCDGKGNCTAGTTTDCKGFTCSATTGCATTCTADTDCPAGYCTSAMTCAATLSDGSTCTKNSQCAHANCISGICCATTCAGTCMTCGTGLCKPVAAGGSSAGLCAAGSTACGHDGTCDGNGGCRYATTSVTCGAPTCSSATDMSMAASFCDGQGNCPAGTTNGCSPFLCGSTSCQTSCSGTGANQCVSTAACIGGSCQTCSTGRSACGNVCADETSDPNHCGSCTTACSGTTPLCVSKKCVQCSGLTDCKTGYFACTNNACVCRQQSSKNLIPNAGFATNISGWTSEQNMATWSGRDADGCPASGSITAPDGDTLVSCIQNVLPNTTYDFGYRYLQDQPGAIDCIVTWATDTACQATLSRFFIMSGAGTGTWASAAGAATSNPGTMSAQILCGVAGNVNIDQVYLNTVISGF